MPTDDWDATVTAISLLKFGVPRLCEPWERSQASRNTRGQVAYVTGGGDHATTFVLLWRVAGIDTDFGHAMPVNLAGQTVGPFSAGDEIQFKTRGSNSSGETDSSVKTITL